MCRDTSRTVPYRRRRIRGRGRCSRGCAEWRAGHCGRECRPCPSRRRRSRPRSCRRAARPMRCRSVPGAGGGVHAADCGGRRAETPSRCPSRFVLRLPASPSPIRRRRSRVRVLPLLPALRHAKKTTDGRSSVPRIPVCGLYRAATECPRHKSQCPMKFKAPSHKLAMSLRRRILGLWAWTSSVIGAWALGLFLVTGAWNLDLFHFSLSSFGPHSDTLTVEGSGRVRAYL